MQMHPNDESEEEGGFPPFVRSWEQLYWLVLAFLFLQIALFHWFTQAFE
jgi:hypothetical protein